MSGPNSNDGPGAGRAARTLRGVWVVHAARAMVAGSAGNPTGLYVGGSADVTIVVSEVTALTIPTAAVQQESGQTYVTVVKDGVQTKTNVTVGRTFGIRTEVTKGLAEGDEVVVPSQSVATGNSSRFPGGGRSGFPSGARPSGFGGPGGAPSGIPTDLPTSQGS